MPKVPGFYELTSDGFPWLGDKGDIFYVREYDNYNERFVFPDLGALHISYFKPVPDFIPEIGDEVVWISKETYEYRFGKKFFITDTYHGVSTSIVCAGWRGSNPYYRVRFLARKKKDLLTKAEFIKKVLEFPKGSNKQKADFIASLDTCTNGWVDAVNKTAACTEGKNEFLVFAGLKNKKDKYITKVELQITTNKPFNAKESYKYLNSPVDIALYKDYSSVNVITTSITDVDNSVIKIPSKDQLQNQYEESLYEDE